MRTRSHDRFAHTFRSSHRFLEVPQKVFFLYFSTTFFDTFGLIRSIKTFSKVLGVGINVGLYMAYILYILFFILYTKKKGVLGVQKNSSQVSGIVWPFWPTNWLIFKAITHTFGYSQIFWEVPQKGVWKNYFLHFLSDPQKLNLNIINMAWWSIGTNNVFVDTHNFFYELKKRGFRGSLRSDFDKTIDQSNVNGFSWNCFHH